MEAIKHKNEIMTLEQVLKIRSNPYNRIGINVNQSKEGEPIETKIERLQNNKEPLQDGRGRELIYTERSEGIKASTNIRTDRFEIALEATDKVEKSYKARREERSKSKEKDGEAKPIQENLKDAPKA